MKKTFYCANCGKEIEGEEEAFDEESIYDEFWRTSNECRKIKK